MRINLPTDLLRSFVTIVDTGSMVRASEHVFLTQSALSLQMKRLAEIIQQPIFSRQHGSMKLTPAGERLLTCARTILALNDELIASIGGRIAGPIKIGMVQDFADLILSGVLERFKRLNPDIRMEIRIGNSAELQDQFAAGLLDITLYMASPDDEKAVATAQMTWLGDPDLTLQPVLPIAIMTKPCLFRDAATSMLDASNRPYAVALETPSVAVLRAAVESGLAITCRTPAFIGNRFEPLDFGGAPLPRIAYGMAVQQSAHAAVTNLAGLIETAVMRL